MPLERYDKYFGGTRGAAAETFAQMKRTYGKTKGEHVFYGTIAKRERKTRRPPPSPRKR